MEGLDMNTRFWKNKRVFITGHTGFKGGWLTLWLHHLGAIVCGYSLTPPTTPNLYTLAGVKEDLSSETIADICDYETLFKALEKFCPEIVIHMAAQPIVQQSYLQPIETYAVNVMGTVHLFEALRHSQSVKVIINVTSDKCYENRATQHGYIETDPLGGHDPYSSSKACSELVTGSYRDSFFKNQEVALASVRAGNVIGGGDWGVNRLIPDFFRAVEAGVDLVVRSPRAIRPWQHVLEPLSGYLTLAEHLYCSPSKFSKGWNFGPDKNHAQKVQWIIDYLCSSVPNSSWRNDSRDHPHESHLLLLDSSQAKEKLGWSQKWNLESALDKTIEWFQALKQNGNMRNICLRQISSYETSGEIS